jgi:hypothetical protein
MVAIHAHELLRRTVGALHNHYEPLSHQAPPWKTHYTQSLELLCPREPQKTLSQKWLPCLPRTTRAQAAPKRKAPQGRKRGRAKRKQCNELTKDNSSVFIPGGFRNGTPKSESLDRRSKHELQGDDEADNRDPETTHGGMAEEHEAFVMREFESLMFDKLKRESQFDAKRISERVKSQAVERKVRMKKESTEAERMWKLEELERREEKERANRWRDRRLAQLEREKRDAESELARERVGRKQSKLQRLFREQQQRHREEEYWKKLREGEARVAADREANLLRENALLENGLHAMDNAFRRACKERDYMAQEKEEEKSRRLRAEESLHRWKELMKECFPQGQQQEHPGQQQEQPHEPPSLEAQFEFYEKKWEVLRSGVDIDGTRVHLIFFSQIPWPVINVTPTHPRQIQPNHVQGFLTHPLREKPGPSGKRRTTRAMAMTELKKWHPDQFNRIVLSRVREEDRLAASEAAGMVVRVLTDMLD